MFENENIYFHLINDHREFKSYGKELIPNFLNISCLWVDLNYISISFPVLLFKIISQRDESCANNNDSEYA